MRWLLVFGLGALTGALAGEAKPSVDKLHRSDVAMSEGAFEVIAARVTIPPNQALPKHHHPGEEYVYLLEGQAVIWQAGQDDVTLSPGQLYKIPVNQLHTGKTGDAAATALVFRVHPKGQPIAVEVQ